MSQVNFPTQVSSGLTAYLPRQLTKLDWKVGLCFGIAILVIAAATRAMGLWGTRIIQVEKLVVPVAAKNELQKLLPSIFQGKRDDPAIKWFSQENCLVFSLRSAPHLVFRMTLPEFEISRDGKLLKGNEVTSQDYENNVHALDIQRRFKLNLLEIPEVAQFALQVGSGLCLLTAQKRIDVYPNSEGHGLYPQHSWFDKAMEQMGVLIGETGLYGVSFERMPIVAPQAPVNASVALFNFKRMNHPERGFFGNETGRDQGLIGCLFSEKQIDTALEQAKKCGVKADNFGAIKAQRMLQIKPASPKFLLLKLRNLDIEKLDSFVMLLSENGDYVQQVTKREVAEKIMLVLETANLSPLRIGTEVKLDFGNHRQLAAFKGIALQSGKNWIDEILEALEKKRHIQNFKHNESVYTVELKN